MNHGWSGVGFVSGTRLGTSGRPWTSRAIGTSCRSSTGMPGVQRSSSTMRRCTPVTAAARRLHVHRTDRCPRRSDGRSANAGDRTLASGHVTMYHGHMTDTPRERTIMASAFKARCLALLDQVAIDHVPIVITKRGRPVARIVPIDEAPTGRATHGSIKLVAEADDAYYTTGVGRRHRSSCRRCDDRLRATAADQLTGRRR